MKRRELLSTAAQAAAVTAAGAAASRLAAQSGDGKGREYYELRRYHLISGPQVKQAETYFAERLIPGLNRVGLKPIGVFSLYLGPETPAMYVLIPASSAEALLTAEARLARDPEYVSVGDKFLSAPAKEPAYERMESSLMVAFEGYPKLTPPPQTAQKAARVFQLRTYESPGMQDHRLKVEMFNSGEFDIFKNAGFSNVFFGDTLIGPRLPNLTYMLSVPDLTELEANWKKFATDADWKKLSGNARYNFESIVSNISNLILNPTTYSQI